MMERMGVMGSHCQLCRLPLQHDHYVPAAEGGYLKIFRGGDPGGGHPWDPGERVVRLGREHAWLADVVALNRMESGPAVFAGSASDGTLHDASTRDDVFIGEGDEDALAYHRYCWSQFGSPCELGAASTAPRGLGTYGWAVIDAYAGQLFELAEFVDQGHGWALVDPQGASPEALRSRARIATVLAEANRGDPPRERPTSVAAVLASDRDWRGGTLRKDGQPHTIVHYRCDLSPDLDRAAYPTLVFAMSEYGDPGIASPAAGADLAAFEAALKPAVEDGGTGIFVMSTAGGGQGQWLVYTRDEAATRAAIDAIPRGATLPALEYANEPDPTWKQFFDDMNPRRYFG